MTLTRDFHETVVARAKRDPAFKPALLMEALQSFLEGEVAPGLIILRDCINATVGFSALSKQTQIPEKSLMRMVGPRGNPTASNLFAIMAALQQANDTRVPRTKARRRARLDNPPSKLASKRKVEPSTEEKREVSWKKVYAAANRAAAKKAEAAKPATPAKRRA
jgi:DNA-binding phage protein